MGIQINGSNDSITAVDGSLSLSGAELASVSGINVSGVVTATSFQGDGSGLTGVASTDNIRTNTNATFLQNINVTGAGITVGTTDVLAGDTFIRPHAIGIGSTTTTGRNAGVGTANGTMVFNADTGALEIYGDAGWETVKKTNEFIASGGTEDTTSRSGYKIHTFTSPGTFTVASGNTDVEYLVVAGGGGGGNDQYPADRGAGGGGAGGMQSGTLSATPGPYTVTVGAGGAGGSNAQNNGTGFRGNPSVFGPITSLRGGGGGGHGPSGGEAGLEGGSGGGGCNGQPGGQGINPTTPQPVLDPYSLTAPYPITQGYAGGTGSNDAPYTGGGGGGAGSAGANGTGGTAGAGGNGVQSSINGSSTYYAGGGGARGGGSNASGGLGGGGNAPAGAGTANTGGGGGGQRGGTGGAGGSGIVIIAYPTA